MTNAFSEFKSRVLLLIITLFGLVLTCYKYKKGLLVLLVISNPAATYEVLNYFILTSITELFRAYIALIIFILKQLVHFIFLYHVISFLSSGLYQKEYKYVKSVAHSSLLLGIMSERFSTVVLIPNLSYFFLSLLDHDTKNLDFFLEVKIQDYFLFSSELYESSFLSFQCFVLLIVFSSYLSDYLDLLKMTRKFFYLSLLVVSTVATPPDVLSQLLLFVGLVSYFEMLVFTSVLKKRLLWQYVKTNQNAGSENNKPQS
jgi:sec-independent protein translocase protein TatC